MGYGEGLSSLEDVPIGPGYPLLFTRWAVSRVVKMGTGCLEKIFQAADVIAVLVSEEDGC